MQILAYEMIKKEIVGLRDYHSQHKVDITSLLGEGKAIIKSAIDVIDEKIRQFDVSQGQNLGSSPKEVNQDEYECRDVHINTDGNLDLLSKVCSLADFQCILLFSLLYTSHFLSLSFFWIH